MNYSQAIQELFSRRHHLDNHGFEAFLRINESLGSPQESYPTVHIAGTNGKGSVALKIARALEFAGLKVGLYTSPHIESFCERITINGVCIPESVVSDQLPPLFRYQELCFFELATLLAFQYFQAEKVDVAVIETGVGGKEDATNVMTPLVSIITSIAKDHEELLGSTLKEIAFQKAGIIKPKIPVVLGPTADYACIREQAKLCRSELHLIPPVIGFYDLENRAVAEAALLLLKRHFFLPASAIEEGLKVRPVCRFEVIERAVLDVAHNPAGFRRLLEALQFHFPGKPFSSVVGMSSDKDIETCLKLLANSAEHLYLVPSPALKAASLDKMGRLLKKMGALHFSAWPSIQKGLNAALTKSDDLVVVCGSFYIMKEARVEISQHNFSLLG